MEQSPNDLAPFIRRLEDYAGDGYGFLRRGTQEEVFDGFLTGLRKGQRHGYIELPTGVGKTALFLSFVEKYLEAINGREDAPRVLIVVPSERLAVQTAQSFARFLPKLAPTIEADDDQGRKIDWEASEIGLQYGKVKHAHRKPKVLITTYQSLIRDEACKTYPPKEYGFVIYDEGHSITAPKFGVAVDKFKESIQLAVTATPEYSEEKAVAHKLPHRFFTLATPARSGIAEAINRGDLCGVRPVLLKTNFTIDKDRFDEYVRRNGGKKLSDKQLQSLLNQEARNRAVIDTYLLASDPDSGECYLGQNGMVFCTGTQHADDLVAQFAKALGKEEYSAVREWLDHEQLELIAPVHGNVKGAWLRPGMLTDQDGGAITEGRRRQGLKEWYSEEEIFDLHAKGRILLLASVAKLKWGYDCQCDSILFDLADRFSKVDATQIDGRAFRLNPADPANNDPGNPDKIATLINLVDVNAYELYKDCKQSLPIYCAEVVDGAEFRKPIRRPGTLSRFTTPPPHLDHSLEDAGFELMTDIEKVREISRQYRQEREKSQIKAPPPPEGWRTGRALTADFVGNGTAMNARIEALAAEQRAEFLQQPGATEEQADEEVARKWVRWCTAGPKEAWHISPEGVAKLVKDGRFRRKEDKALPPPEGWRTAAALVKEFGASSRTINTRIEALAAEQRAASLQQPGATETLADEEVASKWVRWCAGSSQGKEAWHISPEGVAKLEQDGKLRRREAASSTGEERDAHEDLAGEEEGPPNDNGVTINEAQPDAAAKKKKR